jgi:hypothetical protein
MMKPYQKYGFQGVIARDEIDKLTPKPKMSFIMNTDKSTGPGEHWVAVYIDTTGDKSVEFYNPFGEDPPKSFFKDIKKLLDKIKPDEYLKMKINKVVDQRANSSNCGWLSMRFLMNRFKGQPFKECSGWSEVMKSENAVKKMKKKFKKFGYI